LSLAHLLQIPSQHFGVEGDSLIPVRRGGEPLLNLYPFGRQFLCASAKDNGIAHALANGVHWPGARW